MGKATQPRPRITVESGRAGSADIAALPFSSPGPKPAGDAAPTAPMNPAGRHSLLGAGGALAAYTGSAGDLPDFGTFDGGDAD